MSVVIEKRDLNVALLERTQEVCSLRAGLEIKKEQTSLEIGALLYEVKKQQAAEKVLGTSFYEWVESHLTDTNGKPRTGAWAAKMVQSWISVVKFPKLGKFFTDGYVDEDGHNVHASWAQVVAAADYCLATREELLRFKAILAENELSKKDDCTPEQLVAFEEEANERAADTAIELCKKYKSQRIREMIREFAEDKAGIDSRVDVEQKFSFKMEGIVVQRFMDNCKRLSDDEGSDWAINTLGDAVEFCSVFLDDLARTEDVAT